MATAPAVTTLAAVMVVVAERILALPCSRAVTARRLSSWSALFIVDTPGEARPGW
jgi:hypothetical protein